jgi:hypothetical protein
MKTFLQFAKEQEKMEFQRQMNHFFEMAKDFLEKANQLRDIGDLDGYKTFVAKHHHAITQGEFLKNALKEEKTFVSKSLNEKGRCWPGHKPVPGKKPYSPGSCVKEDLRKWFAQKWVRMDTKGNIKGDCAREPGEGKPKCLPQSKAHALGKEGRASAAQRKRREDPNPERRGSPINVRTK